MHAVPIDDIPGGDIGGLDVERRMSGGERVAALVVSVALAVFVIVVTPRAAAHWIEIPGFMAAFGSATMVIDLVLAVLLFSKGAIARRAAPIRLGTAYLFAAFIIVPHIASFPGAIMLLPLIGTSASAVWLWTFWHAGFALTIIAHAVQPDRSVREGAIGRAVCGVAMTVALLALVATKGVDLLPNALTGRAYFGSGAVMLIPLIVVACNVAALIVVATRLRLRCAQDMWLAVGMLAACVDVWLTFQAGSRFTLGWYVSRIASLLTSIVVLISLFRDITELYSRVARANRQLARLAHLDGLTGLANRRHLDDTIATEWRRARRDCRALSVVLLDVDQFKRFNDTYGHLEGDACLRLVAARLRAVARRPGDLAARYGGEEFVLILPATDAAGAALLAHEVRGAVRDLGIPHAASHHGLVTVSVGVATAVPWPGEDVSALLALADAALFRAKAEGRDLVRAAPVRVAAGRSHRTPPGSADRSEAAA
jgi:diguanylate cyclase (GGDEF)-like protein